MRKYQTPHNSHTQCISRGIHLMAAPLFLCPALTSNTLSGLLGHVFPCSPAWHPLLLCLVYPHSPQCPLFGDMHLYTVPCFLLMWTMLSCGAPSSPTLLSQLARPPTTSLSPTRYHTSPSLSLISFSLYTRSSDLHEEQVVCSWWISSLRPLSLCVQCLRWMFLVDCEICIG